MWLKTGSYCVGVDLMTPAILLMVLFSCASILCTCGLFSQTGAQYSAIEKTRPRLMTMLPKLYRTAFELCCFLALVFQQFLIYAL